MWKYNTCAVARTEREPSSSVSYQEALISLLNAMF